MGIKKTGVTHISKFVKKVVKKAKAPKVDKLKTKIHNKENMLQQDSPHISNKAYNRDSREIAEMKRELGKLIKD
tara:strand:+ start:213 stop:434 length:222 start_codon:yes stop_codon:yes gene_type:complete